MSHLTSQQNPIVIALDPGNGTTNVATRLPDDSALRVVSLQSSVADRPVEIGYVGRGVGKAERNQTQRVEFGGQVYLAGTGAWNEGRPISTVLGHAYHTPARRALFYAALAEILPSSEDPTTLTAHLVIGLPVALMQNTEQADITSRGLVAAFKGEHRFTVDGKPFAFTVPQVKGSLSVLSQPEGAYLDWRLGDDLKPRPGRGGPGTTALVLDFGMGTFDQVGVAENEAGSPKPIKNLIFGDDLGVHWLLRAFVEETGLDIAELDARLRAGRLTIAEENLDAWMDKVIVLARDRAQGAGSSFKRFSAVIPVGGGVMLLGERLKLALMAKGAKVDAPADPLTANVQGFWKYGARKAATAKPLTTPPVVPTSA